ACLSTRPSPTRRSSDLVGGDHNGGEECHQPPRQGPESHAGMSGEGNRGRSMKILIVSDTHRRDGNLLEVIEKTAPFDMMIHLGRSEEHTSELQSRFDLV